MKTRILSFLAGLAAILTVIGGIDLSGWIDILPKNIASALATALPALAAVVHLAKAIGDMIDDGEINGSFKLVIIGFLCAGCLLLPSCAGIGSAITGQPIQTTPLQRFGSTTATPFEVATSDVVRAESQPGRVWGLYDAGLVAARASEVIDSGK